MFEEDIINITSEWKLYYVFFLSEAREQDLLSHVTGARGADCLAGMNFLTLNRMIFDQKIGFSSR